MKIFNRFKGILMAVMALGVFFTLGSKNAYATNSEIARASRAQARDWSCLFIGGQLGQSPSRTFSYLYYLSS